MPQNEPPAELIEIAARFILGPREPVPPSAKYTLAELHQVYWDQSSEQERKEALWVATAVLAAVTPQIEARVVAEIAKRFDHIRSDLNNISRAIEDEGDRCYLGSTNDADELRRIAQEFEDWLLARERGDHKESQP